MNKQNYKHSTLEKLAWIGSFLGGFAALGAAILLICNLCAIRDQLDEMQKQTEFENKGFLAMVIDSFTLEMKPGGLPKGFIVYFRYHEASRIPVLIKQPRMVMVSDWREEDINDWIVYTHENPEEALIHTEVNVYEDTRKMRIEMIQSVKDRLDQIVLHSRSEEVSFFLHVIFKYEDITGENYWIYMRWNLIFRGTGGSRKKLTFGDTRLVSEEYKYWEADPEAFVPDSLKLPEELNELTQKARQRFQ